MVNMFYNILFFYCYYIPNICKFLYFTYFFYKLTDTSYTSGQFYKLLALKPNTYKWWVIYLLVIVCIPPFFLLNLLIEMQFLK